MNLHEFTWIYMNLPEFILIEKKPQFTWISLTLVNPNLPEFTWIYQNLPNFTWIYLQIPKF